MAGSSSYPSASYAVKASDVGKRIRCQVRGTTSATTGEKHAATAAVQAADPDVPSAGASFYYAADSTVEKVSGSGMRVEMKGEAASTTRCLNTRTGGHGIGVVFWHQAAKELKQTPRQLLKNRTDNICFISL